jgi:outer membrane protein assembly factor BamA
MRSLCWVILSVFAVIAPTLALAQAPASAVIAEFHATGTSHYSDAQVAAAAGVHVGETVTRDDLQAAANRLVQLGVFSTVNYRFTPRKEGKNEIVLEFQLADNADVVPVTFDNFPWFSDEELSAAIRGAVPFYDGSAPPDGKILDTITASISKLLQDRHVPGSLEHRLLARPDSDAMTLQFRLDGPDLTIGSLDYSDSLAQASPELADRKNDLVGKPFSRFAIEVFELEQIRPLYFAAGHLRVNFGAPVAHLNGNAGQPAASPVPSNVAVQIPIDPGPVFHFSSVTWDGNQALDDSALNALSTVDEGDMADGMKLAALWRSAENAYGHLGYIHAHADAHPEFDDDAATVSYRVSIDEGAQYRMGALVITGLSPNAEGRVRTAWKLQPGTIFDATYADEMFAKLEMPSPQVFGTLPIHYDMEGHLLRIDEKNHTVDVLIDFQ